MQVTYVSIVSVFSMKLKDLHAWNNCSLLLHILEYCCLYLWTLALPTKWCAFIQLLVQSRCPSASGLKLDQFTCTICCGACRAACCCGACGTAGCCGTCGASGCCGACGTAGPEGGTGEEGWRGLKSLHWICHFTLYFNSGYALI